MPKPQSFECPNCGAPQEYTGGDASAVRCPHCGTSVIVPESLLRGPSGVGRRSRAGCIAVLMIASLAAAAVPIFGWLAASRAQVVIEGLTALPATIQVVDEITGQGADADAIARETLRFGGEGIGPGLFQDARGIALDGQGHVYVADYTGGRIQRFDASGEFVSLWQVDEKMPVTGLAADRQGTVFVAQGSRLSRYDGATGEPLGEVEYAEGIGFDDVAVAADGGWVASWYSNRDDLLRYDASGRLAFALPEAISGQTGDPELTTRVAVDGLGNVYALGTFHSAVFKFSPDGRYETRFGGAGDEPGQFRAPHAIAVDGQGRVHVSDFKGIQVFDSGGRYLGVIPVRGVAFGLAFDDESNLYATVRNEVLRFAPSAP